MKNLVCFNKTEEFMANHRRGRHSEDGGGGELVLTKSPLLIDYFSCDVIKNIHHVLLLCFRPLPFHHRK